MKSILEKIKALGSETSFNIIKILDENEMTAKEVFDIYNSKFQPTKRRETIYIALEKLVDAEILKKTYNNKDKRVKYSLNNDDLNINFKDL